MWRLTSTLTFTALNYADSIRTKIISAPNTIQRYVKKSAFHIAWQLIFTVSISIETDSESAAKHTHVNGLRNDCGFHIFIFWRNLNSANVATPTHERTRLEREFSQRRTFQLCSVFDDLFGNLVSGNGSGDFH